jgi:hypothetical protein
MTAGIDAKGKIKLSKMENVMGTSIPEYAREYMSLNILIFRLTDWD